jgi:phage terminase small subunit
MTQPAKDRALALAQEYVRNGFDKTKAVEVVTGWAHEVATKNTWRLFNNPVTEDEIKRLMDKSTKSAEMDADRVMKLLTMYAESGITLAKFKVTNADGELFWDFTGATEEELALVHSLEVSTYMEGRGDDAREVRKWKITTSDPLVALDKLARALGMYTENIKVSGELSLIDRINAARRTASDQPDENTVH